MSASFFTGIFVGNQNKESLDTHQFSSQKEKIERYTPIIRNNVPDDFRDIELNEFFQVWRTIEKNYVPKPTLVDKKIDGAAEKIPSREEILWHSIKGLTHAIDDPYTIFFPPVESVEFNKEIITGNIEGIGVYIGNRNGLLTVISPIKNTPAHKAGIKSRDIIVKIDGKDTKDLSIYEASKLIRGEVSTTVVLSILRKDEKEVIF